MNQTNRNLLSASQQCRRRKKRCYSWLKEKKWLLGKAVHLVVHFSALKCVHISTLGQSKALFPPKSIRYLASTANGLTRIFLIMVVGRAVEIGSITFYNPFAPSLEASETGEEKLSGVGLLSVALNCCCLCCNPSSCPRRTQMSDWCMASIGQDRLIVTLFCCS